MLEGRASGVNVAAIGLDDEAFGAPEEVGLVGDAVVEGDPGVCLRDRQGAASAERQKALLQFQPGKRGPGVVGEHRTQDARTAAAARPAEGILHGAQIEKTKQLRLVDGSLDVTTLDVIAEVDQVRATLVQGIPSTRATSASVSVALRWTSMPFRLRASRLGRVMWVMPLSLPWIPQRTAAELCESTAVGP
jgi:hypothetical protein